MSRAIRRLGVLSCVFCGRRVPRERAIEEEWLPPGSILVRDTHDNMHEVRTSCCPDCFPRHLDYIVATSDYEVRRGHEKYLRSARLRALARR